MELKKEKYITEQSCCSNCAKCFEPISPYEGHCVLNGKLKDIFTEICCSYFEEKTDEQQVAFNKKLSKFTSKLVHGEQVIDIKQPYSNVELFNTIHPFFYDLNNNF